jgi:hypothetical protein
MARTRSIRPRFRVSASADEKRNIRGEMELDTRAISKSRLRAVTFPRDPFPLSTPAAAESYRAQMRRTTLVDRIIIPGYYK